MGKLILLLLILGFMGLGIYSYIDPRGSARLWAPVTKHIKATEDSSVFKASESKQNELNKELDSIRKE